ncbi:hypothetical protein KP509_17G014200 [Ceratopteris richardii]|uniref:Uncharacterized protein n=1 Tax=Ceratopteris richardii TaxID=49495 RepID=A0A8T2SVR6_CERRI|nr:hypothetical protein KP509_17G014200 [Ceratopteris richardii]
MCVRYVCTEVSTNGPWVNKQSRWFSWSATSAAATDRLQHMRFTLLAKITEILVLTNEEVKFKLSQMCAPIVNSNAGGRWWFLSRSCTPSGCPRFFSYPVAQDAQVRISLFYYLFGVEEMFI